MRVLVLGGTGFLGRHVVAALDTRGHEVVVGSRDPGPRFANPGAPERCVARFEDLIDRLAAYGRPESMMVLSTALSWKPLTAAVSP